MLIYAAGAIAVSTPAAGGGFGVAEIDLADLLPENGATGSAGFVIRSSSPDVLVPVPRQVGDVNADGIDDLSLNPWLVFGRADGFPPELDAADIAVDGVELIGAGFTTGLGDINSDGINDVIVRSSSSEPTRFVYVVYGRETFPRAFDLDSLKAANGGTGEAGFVVVSTSDESGKSIAMGPDVNGDGIDDLIIGEHDVGETGPDPYDKYPSDGRAYVLFGRPHEAPFPAEVHLNDLLTATDSGAGFVLTKEGGQAELGHGVRFLGDVNGDTLGDLFVGGEADEYGGTGEGYVVFGRHTPFAVEEPVTALVPAQGFALIPEPEPSPGYSPYSVRGVRGADVNADGINDLIVEADSVDGHGYVVFGRAAGEGFSSQFRLLGLTPDFDGDGSDGYIFRHSDWKFSPRSAGDFNGDGIVDVPLRSWEEDRGYVYFGRPSSPGAVVNPTTLRVQSGGDGSVGFVINGLEPNDDAAAGIGAVGDVNGDGIEDLMVTAPSADPVGGGRSGATFVFYGQGTLDTDGDTVGDTLDNCREAYNPLQEDSDADGYGNRCDADFDQNCMVDFTDLLFMKARFLATGNLPEDMTGDGVINFEDLALLKAAFAAPPGPSGTTDACTN